MGKMFDMSCLRQAVKRLSRWRATSAGTCGARARRYTPFGRLATAGFPGAGLLREDCLCSKTQAAAWGAQTRMASGVISCRVRPRYGENPHLADTPESALWLDNLTKLIQDACTELETVCAAFVYIDPDKQI